MNHLMSFNESKYEKTIDSKDLKVLGSPLNDREISIIKKKVWGDGYFNRITAQMPGGSHSFLNRMSIKKDDNRYFFIFLKGVYDEDDVFVAEDFNDLIGCIFLEKSLRDGNHREVSSFLNKTKFKMDENMRDMILEYLGDRIWIYDDLVVRNEPVVELINYIRNNY